jgi:hypothetical protein
MRRTTRRKSYPLIRAGVLLFIALLAIYIPLKIYISRSDATDDSTPVGMSFSIFVTSDLKGYREPCG